MTEDMRIVGCTITAFIVLSSGLSVAILLVDGWRVAVAVYGILLGVVAVSAITMLGSLYFWGLLS